MSLSLVDYFFSSHCISFHFLYCIVLLYSVPLFTYLLDFLAFWLGLQVQ